MILSISQLNLLLPFNISFLFDYLHELSFSHKLIGIFPVFLGLFFFVSFLQKMWLQVWETVKMKDPRETLTMIPNEKGFDLSNTLATGPILVTTIPTNMKKLEAGLHLDIKTLQLAHSAVRHSR